MEHSKYKKMVIPYTYNDLQKNEINDFELHLLECSECSSEVEEIKNIHNIISSNIKEEIDENALFESRQELLAQIRNLNRKRHLFEKVWDIFTVPSSSNIKIAYSFTSLVIFVAIGYFFLSNSSKTTYETKETSGKESKFTNLQFIKSNPDKGEVEISFEQITPVTLKGNVNDIEIQKVLAKSLLDNENPGIRLKTVNAILSEKREKTSSILKDALINALKYDDNPGVRKEALNAICNLEFDDQIQDAMIYVLQNDKNSGLRIQAINCLDEKNNSKPITDPDAINVLKKKMHEDENSYIKLRAKTILTKLES